MFSQVQQHLRTNYVPSIQELENIKNLLEASTKEIRHLDHEIARLDKQLDILKEKRSKVQDLLEQYQALVSPARRLSQDVLEEIFLACLPEDRNPCMTVTEAPILLTRICSSWRSIALSSPRLWSAIHIVLPSFRIAGASKSESSALSHQEEVRIKLQQRQAATKEWLERSRSCLLSISVYMTPDDSPGHAVTDDYYDGIVEEEERLHLSFFANSLIPCSQRWYEIDICLSPQVLNYLFKNELSAQCMRALKKLHITCRELRHTSWWDNIHLEWKNLMNSLSSQLTHLTFLGIAIRPSDLPLIPHLPLDQITDLQMDTVPSDMAMNSGIPLADIAYSVFCHCWCLKTLKLNVFNDNEAYPWPSDNRLITLPSLTTMSLYIPYLTAETIGFMKALHLPSLIKLNLEISRYHPFTTDMTAQEVAQMLLRKFGSNLQYLGLYSPSYSPDAKLAKILPMIPNIRTLKLFSSSIHATHDRWEPRAREVTQNVGHFINDDLLYELSPQGKEYSDIRCPKLEVLDFHPLLRTEVSSTALKELMKARHHAHILDNRIAALRQVRIFVNEHREQEQGKAPFGKGSRIYFKKPESYEVSFSPWGGLAARSGESSPETEFWDCEVYTDNKT